MRRYESTKKMRFMCEMWFLLGTFMRKQNNSSSLWFCWLVLLTGVLCAFLVLVHFFLFHFTLEFTSIFSISLANIFLCVVFWSFDFFFFFLGWRLIFHAFTIAWYCRQQQHQNNQSQRFIVERLQNRYFANNWHAEPIFNGRWKATSWREQRARYHFESWTSRRCVGRRCKLNILLPNVYNAHKLP